jgi:lipopolysaccharide biosynthesis regulator YciM
MPEKKEDAVAIVQKWEELARTYSPQDLTEAEKAWFDRAKFADEQSKKAGFVLGGKVNLTD